MTRVERDFIELDKIGPEEIKNILTMGHALKKVPFDEVIHGKQPIVWNEAKNRLHAQKALLRSCMSIDPIQKIRKI